MAKFFKSVLKWVATLVVAYFILFVGLFLILAAIGVAFSQQPDVVENRSVLVVDLGFRMVDRPPSEDPTQLVGEILSGAIEADSISLRGAVSAIEAAARDSRFDAILLQGNLVADGYAASFAALRELRAALLKAADSKPIYAYLDADSLRDLYIKSVATEVWAHPRTVIDFRGLRSEGMYLGEAMERLGVDFQNLSLEEYKSVNEMFDRTGMSDEDRQQREALLRGIWEHVVAAIAEQRGLDVAALNAVAGSELILIGEQLVDYGFADELVGVDEAIDRLAEVASWDDRIDAFRQYDFIAYAHNSVDPLEAILPDMGSGDVIAVVYLEGPIVFGYGGEDSIGDADIADILREVREEERVKGVVLRINSPGGSALAAERVSAEIRRTQERKPVVVSMGGMAASAGYMAAANAGHIFAEPTTITGSIGVAAMFFNVRELANRLSVYFDGVETHRFAGSFSPVRPLNEEELQQRNAFIEQTYVDFVELVAEGRGMTYAEAESLAGGRVYTGETALENGLVDALGGLQDALDLAASQSGVGSEFSVREYPRPVSFEEAVRDLIKVRAFESPAAGLLAGREAPANRILRLLQVELRTLSLLNDPTDTYAVAPLIFPN
jgi:protease-4